MDFGLYIHIPYCLSKCNYCDFYSLGQKSAVPDEYVDALVKRIWDFSPCGSTPMRPDTVYFGGGTPSLLSAKQIYTVISAVGAVNGAEITLEVNPDSVTAEKLADFKSAGVNRLSVGVQTVYQDSLAVLGRRHTVKQCRDVFNWAAKSGFNNISGDLMLATPGYSYAECRDSIKFLAQSGCTHISAYMLKIENGTRFGLHTPKNMPTDDQAADFYLYALNRLSENGFRQYEVSNFSKPGFESRHNLIYWNCGNYLGIGAAAHSCISGRRFYYPRSISDFINGCKPVSDGNCTADDYIMLSLRLNRGLSRQKLRKRFGVDLSDAALSKLAAFEKGDLCRINGDTVSLTPNGMLVQNSILTEIL